MDSMLYSRAAFSGGHVAIAADAAFLHLPAVVAPQLRSLAARHTRPDGSLKTVAFETRSGFAPEAYRLEITSDAATVAASDETGLFYGAQTLMRALEEPELPLLELEDAPLIPIRGFKLYLPAPDAAGMTAYKEAVDFLSRFKYNFLMLEIGGAMEFKSHPELNAGWLEYCEFMNEYSGKPQKIQGSFAWRKNSIHTTNGGGKVVPQSMVREMIEYAEARHFEVVPEMPSLSHCDYLLTRHPELAERPEDPYPDTCCPNHPDYYKLIFDLFDEVIGVFHPKRMHIGHDEYYSVALCPRCRDKSAAEIYAADINKCSEFLKSRGVSTMIWGEKLLDAHYPNGVGCGGAQIDSVEDGHERHIPAVWPSIDRMPKELQIMHWYWSIDRDLEQAFTVRNMPVVYGNMSLRNFPEWKRRRQAANIQGLCISNWGATDFRTLQRNAIFFDLASAAAWSWNGALDSDDYPAVRDWTLRELYFMRREQYGCELLELVHTCDVVREYQLFFDGWFVDEAADLLGHHILTDDAGKEYALPVIYGSNISGSDVSFDREPIVKTGYHYDAHRLDMRLLEVSCETLPERHGGKTFYRTSWPHPAPGKSLRYREFRPCEGAPAVVLLG